MEDIELTKKIIDIARGEAPADILLKNAFLVNVFTGEILTANVALKGSVIAGVGDYSWGQEVVNLAGKYIIPGLIEAHLHIESSLLTPANFAAAAVVHGTTTVIADPHEIVNVAGLDGLRYMVNAAQELPLDIFYMLPSCVPATQLETTGAIIGPAEIQEGFKICPSSPGLAEVMNFPGVYLKEPDVLAKIKTACENKCLIDGHAPALSGKNLNAYLSAGILTDHECTTLEEALEKLRLGMKIIIREGSAAKNLLDLLPLVNEKTWPNLLFGCDDRHPADLITEGEIDNILRRAVAAGLDSVAAVQIATLNPARHYHLPGLGGIAPGYKADLVVVNNLTEFKVEMVYKAGKLVAREGKILDGLSGNLSEAVDKQILNTVHLPDLRRRLTLNKPPSSILARVIEVLPDQILTKGVLIPAGKISSPEGILKVAVVERHGKNGNVALGLVKGFGLIKGALASTVAHDSHNLILVGENEENMELAAQTVAATGGGLAVTAGGKVLASLALPVAGLMSDLDASTVARQYQKLNDAAREIGCTLPSPFMTMSFLALPVIPELRITDGGLVDVNKLEFTALWA
jgi:adenine deaminase